MTFECSEPRPYRCSSELTTSALTFTDQRFSSRRQASQQVTGEHLHLWSYEDAPSVIAASYDQFRSGLEQIYFTGRVENRIAIALVRAFSMSFVFRERPMLPLYSRLGSETVG